VLPNSERLCVRPHRFALPLLIMFFTAELAMPAENSSLEDGMRQLAERVATIPNFHGSVRLEVHQDANFAAATGTGWKETFQQELEKGHITVTDEANAPPLRISLAETPTQVVLSASTRIGDREEVRIVALNRALLPATALPVASVRLERQLVFASADRIVDASSLWNDSEGGLALLVYRNSELTALKLDASGAVKQSVSLAAANPHATRDPRGELTSRGVGAEVLLPGKSCEFSWSGASDLKCRMAKTTAKSWRNTTFLLSPCDGSGWKLEANGADWTAADLLQVVPEAASRKESGALLSEFPGPVVSMNGEQNPGSALVVTRNLRTGNDEVYKITLACGN